MNNISARLCIILLDDPWGYIVAKPDLDPDEWNYVDHFHLEGYSYRMSVAACHETTFIHWAEGGVDKIESKYRRGSGYWLMDEVLINGQVRWKYDRYAFESAPRFKIVMDGDSRVFSVMSIYN